MIVDMMKYQFVLHSSECAQFIEQLRALGMVDVTTAGYEPSESDRELIMTIEAHAKADRWLTTFAEGDDYLAEELPYTSGEAFASYKKRASNLRSITISWSSSTRRLSMHSHGVSSARR